MRFQILGTAAAEAWPAPFCLCEACEEARRRGGPDIRTRSGALVDDDLKIDFSPDTVAQVTRLGRTLARLRTILFTHPHSDHMTPTELEWLSRPYTNTPPAQPVDLYGNAEVVEAHQRLFGDGSRVNLRFHVLEPLQPVRTSSGDAILPLPADHMPGALLYRVTRSEGKTFFYGHDSGSYPAATLDALCDGVKLDLAIFDTTCGGLLGRNRGHMAIDGVQAMVAEFRRRGILTDATRAIATHFSHNGKVLHEELVQTFLPHRIEVAYDGMMIRV